MKNFIVCLMGIFPLVLSAQYVGIGTNAPTEKLTIDSGAVKVGKNVWSADKNYWLKFGDGDYVKVGEYGDDTMNIFAKNIKLAATQAIYGGVTKVDVSGTLAVNDGTQAIGKVLTCTAADGSANWQNIATSAKIGFSAYASSNLPFAGSADYRVDLTTEEFDDGNNYGSGINTSTFVAPSAGLYHFDVNIEVFFSTAFSSNAFLYVSLNSSVATHSYDNINTIPSGTPSGYRTISFTRDIKMNAGEQLTLYISNSAGTSYSITGGRSYFSGYKVY